jgi:hypothetical protein
LATRHVAGFGQMRLLPVQVGAMFNHFVFC